jgi:hypothetical protein
VDHFRVGDDPDHRRSGPLESPHQSVQRGYGFVQPFENVDVAVLADKRDGEAVAVRRKADAPGQGGLRRRIQRGELLLDAGFDIDRDQPPGVLRRQVPIKIERNERQRCLIKKRRIVEALVALGTRETAESLRRDHRRTMILSHY